MADYGRTWCQDQIESVDTEYIRADLYYELKHRLEEHEQRIETKSWEFLYHKSWLAWYREKQKMHDRIKYLEGLLEFEGIDHKNIREQ
jgi:hypothetical protein